MRESPRRRLLYLKHFVRHWIGKPVKRNDNNIFFLCLRFDWIEFFVVLLRYRKFDADNGGGGDDGDDNDAVVMFLIALAVLVLTLVGYFLFFKTPSQSECSNNVAEQGSDPGSGEVVTGSEATPLVVIATSVSDPGVPGGEEVVASDDEALNVQISQDATEMKKNPFVGALKPVASDTTSLTTEQLPGAVAAVPEEAPATDQLEDKVAAAVQTQSEAEVDSTEIHPGSDEQSTAAQESDSSALPDENQDLNEFHLGDVKFTVGESSAEDCAANEVLENKIINDININVEMSAPKNVRISENSGGNSQGHNRVNNRAPHSSPSKYSSGKLSSDHSSLTKILENDSDGDIVAANSASELNKNQLKRQDTLYESAEVVTFASR